jgi:ABC-2 type transport system permease protein
MTMATGAVYDRGYRPYDGERGGRTQARNALFRASARRALGWRRSWRQKVLPFGLLAIATVPAVVNVGAKYLTRDTPAADFEFISYRDYVGWSNALLLFVAVTAPDIVCPDRRQRVLPLIFARPLAGIDYVLAKVGAMTAILFAFSYLPQVVLFVGQMLVTKEGALTYARENAEVLWQVPIAVALLSLWYAVIGVALASLTSRRIIAGAMIVGLFLVTSITSSIIVESGRQTGEVQQGPVIGPTATSIDENGNTILVPGPQQGDTYVLVGERDPNAGQLINLAALPLVLRDLVFLGHVNPGDPMSGLAGAGEYAIGLYVLIVVGGFVLLFLRYREAET